MPTAWGADWDTMQYSQSLSHKEVTPTSVVHELATLKTWGIDHNNIRPFQFNGIVCEFLIFTPESIISVLSSSSSLKKSLHL